MSYLGPDPDGSAILPGSAFSSELSLGWYRSAASTVALSYGTLTLPTNLVVATSHAFTGTGTARVDTNAGTIQLAGGTAGVSGNIVLFGGTAAPANEIRFRQGTNIRGTVAGPTGSLLWVDGSAIAPAYAFSSTSSLGFYSLGGQTVAQSLGTFNLATNAVRFSMRTLAASSVTLSAANTNVAINEIVITIGGASGASICINSGGTTYIISSDLSAKNT